MENENVLASGIILGAFLYFAGKLFDFLLIRYPRCIERTGVVLRGFGMLLILAVLIFIIGKFFIKHSF